MPDIEFHALEVKAVYKELETNENGLSESEAKKRLDKYGKNKIEIERKISPWEILIAQFKNLLVILLIIAALVSFAIGIIKSEESELIDAVLIFAIVIANALFGFFQEYKAEKTIEELTKMSAPRATVIRDGKELDIDSEEVVPGDIILLDDGDKVAADARVIESFSMYCDESMLTGESVPSCKKIGKMDKGAALAERSNIVYMNSIVTRGRGAAIVIQTGLKTEVGKIAKEISEAPEKVTQFQIEIEDVGEKVSLITFAILVVIGVTEFLLRTGDILFIFIAAVALGVAAIPEGLPAVVTLALSIATNRMLKQNALMRRLSTVQDLGSIDVICTDKTGTLTENVMTVTKIYFDGNHIDVTGKGFDKKGEFKSKGKINKSKIDLFLKCATLCNDAREIDGKFKGDPTEIAVLLPAYKVGFDVEGIRKKLKRVGEISFSSERKMMSTVNNDGKSTYCFIKGAPEIVLSKCTKIIVDGKVRKITSTERDEIIKNNNNLSSDALRVLAFAYKENPKSYDDEKEIESDLIYLGLMGMIDPPRTGVKEAVEDCRKAGIRVIMITGDNRYTAEAIGAELGFSGKSITGDQLDKMSEKELLKIVEEVDIYARTSPKHKVMLLKALKQNNHVVCMTGDGVNDAAAIKNADVGIAMGIRGTEVTKQASDMIVLDDNFITIRNAIKEGRVTFDNIRKFVAYLLGANISEVLIIFICAVASLGISAKIAVQLLWINLVTDGLPALALGVDPPEKDVMERKPRKKDERIISKDTIYFLTAIGISATIALLLLFIHMLSLGDKIKSYTMLFTGFVVLEMFVVYVVRWRYHTKEFTNMWLHVAVVSSISLQLFILYSPFNTIFGIAPLTLEDWAKQVGTLVVFAIILAIEMKIEPWILKNKNKEILYN